MSDRHLSSQWRADVFEALVEHLGEIISIYSLEEQRFLYVSPLYEEISGRGVDRLYTDARAWLGDIHPDDRERVRAAIGCLNEGPVDEQYRVVTLDGGTRWIRSRGCCIQDEQHGSILVGASVDFTEKKLLGAQLAQAQKLESVGQLAAGIAHEINTPTQYVGDNLRFLSESFGDLLPVLEQALATLSVLQQERADARIEKIASLAEQADLAYLSEEIPRALAQSLDGVARVSKIVRAMKDFSHPGREEKTETDLNAAIESTVTVARGEWKYVAEVDLDLDPELPWVLVLAGEINQVILNLLVNAAHAIAERLGEGSSDKGRIVIRTRRLGDAVEIRISDTGAGIPEEIRSRIFDCFFTTKPVGKGTGQGLHIARSVIVEQHGGSIRVESEPGHGSEFILQLPIAPSGDAAEAPSGEPAE